MKKYPRFFTDSEITGGEAFLTGASFNHAVNTLRLKKGDMVTLSDGTGFDYMCKALEPEKKQIRFMVLEKQANTLETRERVTLICGFLKGDKTELVVQKAVELGITEIVAFTSKNSSAFINENKLLRLNKVSEESAKQCGRARFPKVIHMPLTAALESYKNTENRIFACEFEEKNAFNVQSLKGDTCIVVGSEGGFTEEETELAVNLGYNSVTLGKRILRAETAAIALTALVMYGLGELK